ncbi:polymer-forming cytoskeletal protein [Marinobacter sp. chi1]|uniref:Polymer-forming cytoskeletal protein n=1 Tax=Marinobacter suaedae TaxID=3057675 RepID=A0ABT8W0Q2_9GAMM|nr:polymer-forming cytoskeletal protein [Marinobacter sp. chi1]MDO3721820.1 polymer-forming cytoskeletal protein [Marinobacter sp. chi1]
MLRKKKQKPRRPAGNFDTLISAKTTVDGDITFSGGLHVDGQVRGKVVAEEGSEAVLRISEIGDIAGDIVAPHVIINGKVHGDVYSSTHLELAENAAISGNVYYNLIEMAMGASVNGNLVHQQEPVGLLTDASSKRKADKAPEAEAALAGAEDGGKSE